MTDKAFVAGMRLRRLQKKWSQKHLANLIEVHKSYVSHIEAGRRGMSVGTRQRICKAFGVTAATLERIGQEHLAKENDGEL